MNSKSYLKIFKLKFQILKVIQNSTSSFNSADLIPKYHFHFVKHPTQKNEIIKKLNSNIEIRKYSSTMCHFVRVNKSVDYNGSTVKHNIEDDVFKRITNSDNKTVNNQLPFYLCRPFPKTFENIFGKEVGDENI